jgi:hypothetical protein
MTRVGGRRWLQCIKPRINVVEQIVELAIAAAFECVERVAHLADQRFSFRHLAVDRDRHHGFLTKCGASRPAHSVRRFIITHDFEFLAHSVDLAPVTPPKVAYTIVRLIFSARLIFGLRAFLSGIIVVSLVKGASPLEVRRERAGRLMRPEGGVYPRLHAS